MGTYNTSANVVLTLNGKQASNMFASLEKDAEKLRKKIDAAASAGDKASMKKFQRELNSVNKTMDQLRGNTLNVEKVLHSLDTASPKGLQRTLRQLKQELNGIERGSEAWQKHINMIKRVKAEIDSLNASMREQQSWWGRFNGWLNNCQTALLGMAAGATGLIMAGKSAVGAFADMDQEMANVRKFTGLTAEQVDALNEEFKKMDTRTSREELNKLAQEAGRLGKTDTQDILGYVRAADKVNIALDDLGENATLTLSKLTNVFGDEERLGTEKALLSVGSVINELSQNCSASAPYLAEFASRLGGVGSQAGMSVQQIMGFAAVLDSANQPLEASATALSQVIVRIYQEPAKYAKVAGLDVQKFSNLVRTDMNAAIIELMTALQKAGGMDSLAPMFADMGEKGSRAIATLSTLAGHIEEVKSQQEVANQAFAEATSIDKEAAIQNSTVRAELEKAKNDIHNLAVSLGEKLMPVMRLFISSSTLAIKGLSMLVDFVKEYKYEIIAVATSVAGYITLTNLAAIKTKLFAANTKILAAEQKVLNTLLGVGKIAVAAVNVVVGLFTGGLKGARTAMQNLNATIKANPFGMLVSVITTAITAISIFKSKAAEARKEQEEQAKAQAEAAAQRKKEYDDWKKSLTDINEKSAEVCRDELARLDLLYKAATDEARSKEERIQAAQKLQNMYPDYFRNMSIEQIMLGEAAVAYENLRDKILEAAKAKAVIAKIEENEKALIDLELEQEDLEKDLDSYIKNHPDSNKKPSVDFSLPYTQREYEEAATKAVKKYGYSDYKTIQEFLPKKDDSEPKYAEKLQEYNMRKEMEDKIASIENKRNDLTEANNILAGRAEDINIETKKENKPPKTGGIGKSKTVDKFAAEKEWREQQEALEEIAYAKGEKLYSEHTARMDEIAVEFYKMQLEHSDLSKTERLKIEAQLAKAQAKQIENAGNTRLEDLKQLHNDEVTQLKQDYIDGVISKETYDLKMEEYEMDFQKKLSECTEIGDKARLDATNKYMDLQIRAQERAHAAMLKEFEQFGKSWQKLEDDIYKVRIDVFGLSAAERVKEYNDRLLILEQAYERQKVQAAGNAEELLNIEKTYLQAIAELKKEYMQGDEDAGGFRKAFEKSLLWLESDGGKAMTGAMSTLTSGMSSIFSQLTSSMQADLEIQTAAINRRYEAEISRAEGNSYKIAQLEEKKQQEIAAAKNEANRKMFAMQVIQAVAQTAQNAVSAYGSAAAIPLVGHILAPIAASMAVAAGMLQVATIKKQAQASEAQGYEQGGFTRPGKKDEPAGIVHAGEWVAPQSLVNSPVTRPLINALELARKNNTVGYISQLDVSRAITAPMVMAASAYKPATAASYSSTESGKPYQYNELNTTIKKLTKRLEQPFVTVNAVTGKHGMMKAERDYNRLMANKSRRRRNRNRTTL